NDEGAGLAARDELETGLAAVFPQLHQIFVECRGDDFQQGEAGSERAVDLLAAQGYQRARQVLADGGIVLVVSGQRGDFLKALGVPIGKLPLDDAPKRRCLQRLIEGVRCSSEALERRSLDVPTVR